MKSETWCKISRTITKHQTQLRKYSYKIFTQVSWWSTQRLHIIFLFAHERQPILHTSIPQHPSLIHSPSIIYNRPMCHLKLSQVTIYFCRMTSPKSKQLTKWQKVRTQGGYTPQCFKWGGSKMEPDKTEIGFAFISLQNSEGKHSSTVRTSEESPWPLAVPWTIHWWLPLNAARPTVLPEIKHKHARHESKKQ